MKRFEYIKMRHPDTDKLNELGAEGWELNQIDSLNGIYLFKRELRELNGQSQKGEKNGQSKLKESQVIEIRIKSEMDGVSNTQLAKEYGVSRSMIEDIVKRNNWKHI